MKRGQAAMSGEVNCPTHGLQESTLVCQPIVDGLRRKVRVGFWWNTENVSSGRPDACCTDCNGRVKHAHGEWIGEALEKANPQILCGACYDLAKKFHMGGNPWA
jgi:hypothetical protein